MQAITLNVPDVSCLHCVRTIQATLGEEPGVHSVEVNVESKTVRVVYEPDRVSLSALKQALDGAGYPVSEYIN